MKATMTPFICEIKIRHELIPLLEKEYNPRIVEGLSKLALIAREENDFIEGQTQQTFKEVLLSKTDSTIKLKAEFLSLLPMALCKRVILHALSELAGEEGWEANDIDIILDLMTKSGSSKIVRLKKMLQWKKSMTN